MKVKKNDLIKKIANKNPDLTLEQINRIVKCLFEEISIIMANGDSYNQVNFGRFSSEKRKPRMGRNLETREPIVIEEYYGPKFKASKTLKKRIKGEKN